MLKYIEFEVKSVAGLLDQGHTISAKCTSVEHMLNRLILSTKNTPYYGVTLTFRIEWHEYAPITLHRYIEREINNSHYWRSLHSFVLIPEFTKSGVLHYHGMIFGSYKSLVMSALSIWKRRFGFTKPEFTLKYVHCGSSERECVQSEMMGNAEICWIHYLVKEYDKTGLWTICNID